MPQAVDAVRRPWWMRGAARGARLAAGRLRPAWSAVHRAVDGLVRRWRYRHLTGPILVFQMGKVGSWSVYRPLRDLRLPQPVYHAHHLVGLDAREAELRSTVGSQAPSVRKIARDREVARLVRSDPATRWNVVTLVREPVARNVSTFFQVLDELHPGIRAAYADGLRPEDRDVRRHVELLRADFWDRFGDHFPDSWFDEQLKPTFGIDVFEVPFPAERGYLTIRRGRITLLVIRLESLEQCAEPAFRDAFRIPKVRPGRHNTADEKWYRDLYRRFLDGFVVPDEYLTRMYASRFARHFYTATELARFRARWSRRGSGRIPG